MPLRSQDTECISLLIGYLQLLKKAWKPRVLTIVKKTSSFPLSLAHGCLLQCHEYICVKMLEIQRCLVCETWPLSKTCLITRTSMWHSGLTSNLWQVSNYKNVSWAGNCKLVDLAEAEKIFSVKTSHHTVALPSLQSAKNNCIHQKLLQASSDMKAIFMQLWTMSWQSAVNCPNLPSHTWNAP